MEDALGGAEHVTILRPGAIYGPHLHRHVLREWDLVGRVARGERALPLLAGGTQLFHRMALDRVGRAIAAALEHAPAGRWAANVADPQDLTYGGLATLVSARLGWEWEPEVVDWDADDHPWNVRHPVLADTARLRDVLGVTAPDPLEATETQIDWLWEHRAAVAALPCAPRPAQAGATRSVRSARPAARSASAWGASSRGRRPEMSASRSSSPAMKRSTRRGMSRRGSIEP